MKFKVQHSELRCQVSVSQRYGENVHVSVYSVHVSRVSTGSYFSIMISSTYDPATLGACEHDFLPLVSCLK